MKTALITGASSGIGLCIAHELQNSGFKIFKTGRRELENKNYLSADLSDINNVKKIYEAAVQYLGQIDILINNAGEFLYKPVENMTAQEMQKLININFAAHYQLCSLVVSNMKKNKFGRIINIGSISGIVGEANASLYSATKAALGGMTRALALELAQDYITVNQINPGWVETPLTQSALNENERKETLDVIPQKRFVEPNEIAGLVEYLISDSAKGITGQNINICAGLSIGC